MNYYINTYYLNGKIYNKNIYFKSEPLDPNGFECYADPEFYIKLKVIKIQINLHKICENDDNMNDFIKQVNCFIF